MRIEKSEIAGRLSKVKNAIPGENAPSGIQGVLIKGNKAIASDYKMSITALLPVETDKPFVLNKKAITMIESLPNGIVEICSENNNFVAISAPGIKNKFAGTSPDEFSEPKSPENIGESIKIESKKLFGMVTSVLYAASQDESKPTLTGVLFEAAGGELNIVACDSFRMVWNKTDFDGDFKFIVPKDTLSKMLKLGISGDIEISLGENNAVFSSDEYIVHTNLIAGDYMDYRKVFPAHDNTVEFDRNSFIEAIGRVLICIDKEKSPMIMTFNDGEMVLSLQTSETKHTEEIAIIGSIDNSLKIGFNPTYLRDAMKQYNDERVKVFFGSALQPVVVSGADEKMLSLVLPLRLKS